MTFPGGSSRGERRRELRGQRRRPGRHSLLPAVTRFLRTHRALAWTLLVYSAGLASLMFLYALLDGTAPLDWYLIVNAQATGFLVNLLGAEAYVTGNDVISPAFSIRIVDDCTSLVQFAVFAAAVMAAPVALRPKLIGLLSGFLVLSVVNLVRTTSLFYIGVIAPEAMDVAHYLVWQSVMVLVGLGFWFAWMRHYSPRTVP